MILALGNHAFKLMTFRHDGTGLATNSFLLMCFLILLSGALAYARWEIVGQAVTHSLLLLLICFMSRPIGLGYALLSAGIDTLAIALAIAVGTIPDTVLGVWEAFALGYFVYRSRAFATSES